jgi:hypothetical protein
MVRVLVALEPRSYREAIGQVIEEARLQANVYLLDSDPLNYEAYGTRLDYETNSLKPHVVLCQQTTPAVRELAICWVKILIYEHPQAVVSIAGEAKRVPDISLSELISVIDEANVLTAKT